eukprot:gnl/Chilomastix_caulleri/2439.p2 GENE.gnl/Chilomastix_caulleri/2439~~gnl/Chilomastix_caulleri/2439.p2  ORF type:complete len:102 (+),score=39.34 gnl/Chilomastix_caulleri/2439:556-861(+)
MQQGNDIFGLGSQTGQPKNNLKGKTQNNKNANDGKMEDGRHLPQQHNTQLLQALAALQDSQVGDSSKGKDSKQTGNQKTDSMSCTLSKMNAASIPEELSGH